MLYAVVLLMDNKLDCLDLRSEVNLLLVSSGLIFTTGHFLGLEGSLSSFPCDVHVGLGSVLDSGMMFLNLLLDGLLQLLDIDSPLVCLTSFSSISASSSISAAA